MIIYLTSLFLATFVILLSKKIGIFIHKKIFNNDIDLFPSLIGLAILFGLFFLYDYVLILFKVRAQVVYILFLMFCFIFLIFTFRLKVIDKKHTIYYIIEILFILLIFALSIRYGLGEKLGDNYYLTNMVTMNVNTEYLNLSEYSTGLKMVEPGGPLSKIYLSWYHFFSMLIFMQQRVFEFLKLDFIPSYILFVYTGNLLFYFYSAKILTFFIRKFENFNLFYFISILLIGIYWGTIYYNLVLAHYGTDFVSIFTFILFSLLLLKLDNIFKIIVVIISTYALLSIGNVGLIVSSFLISTYVVYEIINKNRDIFKWIPVLFLPIFHFIYLLSDLIPTKWLFPLVLAILFISFFIHKSEFLKDLVFNYSKQILLALIIFIYVFSFTFSNDFNHLFNDFFSIKSNFDRVQDYFSFDNIYDSIRNILYYLLFISLFLTQKTRKIGMMVGLILVLFINPIVFPLLYPKFQWLYHRSYISLFNMFVVLSATWSIYLFIQNKKPQYRAIVLLIFALTLVPSIIVQTTQYFNLIYEPSDDFNYLLKLDNNEIDVLENLRQIVEIEKFDNARVISQIYASSMYIPDINQIYFNVHDRRNYFPGYQNADMLFYIFYSPAFEGDDGPRFEAPFRDTYALLISNKIDFVIYNKNLSVYDKEIGAWMPLYWYIKDYYTKVYENDDYILYRFFW